MCKEKSEAEKLAEEHARETWDKWIEDAQKPVVDAEIIIDDE